MRVDRQGSARMFQRIRRGGKRTRDGTSAILGKQRGRRCSKNRSYRAKRTRRGLLCRLRATNKLPQGIKRPSGARVVLM